MLSQPVELVRVQRSGSAAFKCAVAEMQGWRCSHEDSHAMRCDGSSADFWVLDGHRGDKAANFGAYAFPGMFGPTVLGGGELPPDDEIREVFEAIDEEWISQVGQNLQLESGSTVLGALASQQDDGLYSMKLLNCGDSRGVVIRSPDEDPDLSPVLLESVDHKPCNPAERSRIEAAGGWVSENGRVNGLLAMSRCLGDSELKSDSNRLASEQKVSCVPDVSELRDVSPGTIVVLACDGLWDVMGADDVAAFVQSYLRMFPEGDLGEIASLLVLKSLAEGSLDNVTVMISQFVDGSAWASAPDEMKFYEKLQAAGVLSDKRMRRKYREFLGKSRFPLQPCASSGGRWLLEKEQTSSMVIPAA